eukprot:s2980_g6.t1
MQCGGCFAFLWRPFSGQTFLGAADLNSWAEAAEAVRADPGHQPVSAKKMPEDAWQIMETMWLDYIVSKKESNTECLADAADTSHHKVPVPDAARNG